MFTRKLKISDINTINLKKLYKRVYKSTILDTYYRYKEHRIMIHKLEQLENGNLHFEVYGLVLNTLKNIDIKLIITNREVPLLKENVVHSIMPSFIKIKANHYFFATFIVPLDQLIIENSTILHIWDFYLHADKKYRVQYSKKSEVTLKKLNFDLIPYSTTYKEFSIMAIRKKSKYNLLQYKKSITFILFRIDYKGGVTKVTIDLANALAEKGYKVRLVAINIINAPNNFPISQKVDFDYMSLQIHSKKNVTPSNIYSKKETMDIYFSKKLKEFFSNLDTDFVYFPIYGSVIFKNLVESIPHKVKKIIGDHSSRRYKVYDQLLKNKKKVSFKELLRLTTDYHLLNNFTKIDAIHIVNPLVKPIYTQVTHKPILDIPNIVQAKIYEDTIWSSRNKTIMAVGSLSKVKNFDTLIKAFNQLHIKFSAWRLEIYGEGPEKDALVKLIRELSLEKKVLLKGFSANIQQVFKKSMVHVSVSSAESFGLTIVEAMSQKTIVLSTNTTIGAKYLIEDTKTGFLAKSNKEKDIIQRLNDVLTLIEESDPIISKIQTNAYLRSQQFNAVNISDRWDNALSLL